MTSVPAGSIHGESGGGTLAEQERIVMIRLPVGIAARHCWGDAVRWANVRATERGCRQKPGLRVRGVGMTYWEIRDIREEPA